MKQTIWTVLENVPIAEGTLRLRLAGDTSALTAPGQFVNIAVENGFLRRPISVCDASDGEAVLLYRAVGKGTRWLAGQGAGKKLDVLTGLGNGFDLSAAGDAPLLVGGGIGAAPLYGLAGALRRQGKSVRVALGFKTAAEVFYEEEFRALGCEVRVATEDGSRGARGFVTQLLPERYSCFYACGPTPMLRAVCAAAKGRGQVSLEERMGCGFGACMGCTCRTKEGARRVCREGPVFWKEALEWES